MEVKLSALGEVGVGESVVGVRERGNLVCRRPAERAQKHVVQKVGSGLREKASTSVIIHPRSLGRSFSRKMSRAC